MLINFELLCARTLPSLFGCVRFASLAVFWTYFLKSTVRFHLPVLRREREREGKSNCNWVCCVGPTGLVLHRESSAQYSTLDCGANWHVLHRERWESGGPTGWVLSVKRGGKVMSKKRRKSLHSQPFLKGIQKCFKANFLKAFKKPIRTKPLSPFLKW